MADLRNQQERKRADRIDRNSPAQLEVIFKGRISPSACRGTTPSLHIGFDEVRGVIMRPLKSRVRIRPPTKKRVAGPNNALLIPLTSDAFGSDERGELIPAFSVSWTCKSNTSCTRGYALFGVLFIACVPGGGERWHACERTCGTCHDVMDVVHQPLLWRRHDLRSI